MRTRLLALLIWLKPGLCIHINKTVGSQARISWVLHTGLELPLVRDTAESMGLPWSQMELTAERD